LDDRRVVPLARRRVAALVLLLLVTAGLVVVAIVVAGGEGTAKVPEGGSSFGAGARPTEGQSLMDALAPLLAVGSSTPAGAGGRTSTAAPAVTASGVTSSPAKPAAGAPVTEQEIAQLFLVGFRGTDPANPFFERLALRRWGGVIVDGSNYAGEAQLKALTARATAVLRDQGAPAPVIAADQGGGDDSTLRGLGPRAQATVGSRAEARSTALNAAHTLRSLGIRMVLAPSADIGYGAGAWAGRAYGEDPAQVARLTAGAVNGWRTGGVAPAVGHFPGEGAASQDPADGPATVGLGLADLRAADLRAFGGVLGGTPALMLSNALYAAYDGVTPATLLPAVPALARRTGFHGVIVSGNLAVTVLATGGSIADAAVDALKAGCDLLWIPGDASDQEAAYRAVVHAVRSGRVPRARVRSALAHVTALKRRYVG
jgi:beta-N-acetylhexosaminidase